MGERLIKQLVKGPHFNTDKRLSKPNLDNDNLVFSFRFFQQRDFFGLGIQNCDNAWFIGFLNRLTEFGKIPARKLFTDTAFADNMHFHPVDWEARNIPIKLADALELLVNYDNKEEVVFYQCAVSLSKGRFVGFFSASNVFEIVLLDPNHNIYPCKRTDYKIRETKIGLSSYDDLYSKFLKVCGEKSLDTEPHNLVYFNMDEALYTDYCKLLKSYSWDDILLQGMINLIP